MKLTFQLKKIDKMVYILDAIKKMHNDLPTNKSCDIHAQDQHENCSEILQAPRNTFYYKITRKILKYLVFFLNFNNLLSLKLTIILFQNFLLKICAEKRRKSMADLHIETPSPVKYDKYTNDILSKKIFSSVENENNNQTRKTSESFTELLEKATYTFNVTKNKEKKLINSPKTPNNIVETIESDDAMKEYTISTYRRKYGEPRTPDNSKFVSKTCVEISPEHIDQGSIHDPYRTGIKVSVHKINIKDYPDLTNIIDKQEADRIRQTYASKKLKNINLHHFNKNKRTYSKALDPSDIDGWLKEGNRKIKDKYSWNKDICKLVKNG